MITRKVSFPIIIVLFLITFLHISSNYLISNTEFSHSSWIYFYKRNGWEFNNILQIYFNIYKYQWYFLFTVLVVAIDIIRRKNISARYFSWFISMVVFVNIFWFIFTIAAYYGVYTSLNHIEGLTPP